VANAVFTTKVNPVYDDLPEIRYHFPKTYLNQALQAVGDWILYYEPGAKGQIYREQRGGRVILQQQKSSESMMIHFGQVNSTLT
jgi:hypothetical protein